MSDRITLRIAEDPTYEPPTVSREMLDSGGNYVAPAWPEQVKGAAEDGVPGLWHIPYGTSNIQ